MFFREINRERGEKNQGSFGYPLKFIVKGDRGEKRRMIDAVKATQVIEFSPSPVRDRKEVS